MLLDDIKARMFQMMKAGDVVGKEILRVAVGEITTEAARPGRKGSDEEVQAILRKLIKSNEETLAVEVDAEKRAILAKEREVLAAFLPRALSVAEIVEQLSGVADAIRTAAGEGQATGVAMKELKTQGLVVPGKDVGAAVRFLRGA